VLVVDDEPSITEVLRDYLEASGFEVRVAFDGAEAMAEAARHAPDCVVLDLMLPGRSGFDVCRELRREQALPVVFLTALDGDAERLRGLGMADDYVVKNASPAEIVLRVRNVLRRTGGARPRRVVDCGRFQLDLDAHEALVDGCRVSLTGREFDLLRLLVDHPGELLTRERILDALWDGYADASTLWGYVRRLRQKLELDPARPRHIVTVWGVGYRFESGRP
jgi:DNA-binding response OmpR family regulator